MLKARARRLFFAARIVLICGLGLLVLAPPAFAQGATGIPTNALPQGILQQLPPGVTPADAQRLLQSQNPTASQGGGASTEKSQQQIYVTAAPAIAQTTSALESLYSRRAGTKLTQFGYDLVGNGGTPWIFNSNGVQVPVGNGGVISNPQIGAVQDDYILGPGDQLTVTFRGDQNSAFQVAVGRDGTVALPNMSPIPAAGRRFGDFRADVERSVTQTYVRTRVFMSVTQLRELTVRVVGDVANPGTYILNGLSTVLDALNLAGGIKKTGSLRNISVIRGGRTLKLDLYAMLTAGQTPDLTIAQGDRIVVPAIGPTAAVAGDVRRPGIYELPPGATTITYQALEALAQGTQISGIYRQTMLRNRPDGKQELVNVSEGGQANLRDGEVLVVRRAVDMALGSVSLQGAVRLPGEFAIGDKKSLHDLLPSMDVFLPDPYLLFGVINRLDPKTLQRYPVVFSPLHVVAGSENADLMSDDIVRIFTLDQGLAMAAQIGAARQQALDQRANAEGIVRSGAPSNAAIASLALQPGSSATTGAAEGAKGAASEPIVPAASLASGAGVAVLAPDGMSVAGAESEVDLNGAVRRPGSYLVAPKTSLAELIAIAGGLSADADLSQFEVTVSTIDNQSGHATLTRQNYVATPAQFAEMTLRGSEEIVFHHVSTEEEGGNVQIAGEVRYPGTYRIIRGERLTSLIRRAGGYLPSAYPYGSVFTRVSVAKAQNDAYAEEANEMESNLAAYMLSGIGALNSSVNANGAQTAAVTTGLGGGLNPATGSYLQIITDRLRNTKALGRLAINADPDVLARRPDLDIVLEPGDQLTVPRKPASVNVVGEVRNPSGIVFNADLSADDYVRAAGGITRLADRDGAFVIYPDGNSAPLSSGFWSVRSASLSPGSTIVIPRDVTPPVDWSDLTGKLATIVGQIALTAASISIISTH